LLFVPFLDALQQLFYKGLLLSGDEHFGDLEFPLLIVQCLRITSHAPSQAALQGFANTQCNPA
jgi:tRNA isopentenyl-2-thiomethyl-A-37 hydroxylase MiaE